VTDLNNGVLTLACAELNTVLKALAIHGRDYLRGTRVIVGVRPENIEIMGEMNSGAVEMNRLHGRITTLVEKGGSHTLLFAPDGSNRVIEVEIRNEMFHRLNPKTDQNLSISLNHERIFLISWSPTLQ